MKELFKLLGVIAIAGVAVYVVMVAALPLFGLIVVIAAMGAYPNSRRRDRER